MLPVSRWIGVMLWLWSGCVLLDAASLTANNVSVGNRLQTSVRVRLSEPAPETGLEVTVTSEDPGRLLLSRDPARAGSGRIVLSLQPGFDETPEFWLQGLAADGKAAYTAAAPGFDSGSGEVTLTPSAIAIAGPSRAPSFPTTTGAERSRLIVYSVRLDSTLAFVEQQAVAGGLSVDAEILSSDPRVGRISASPVTIAGGSAGVATEFQPVAPGSARLSVSVPPGFSPPARLGAVVAVVKAPGIAITDKVTIGRDLQVGGMVGLGEAAGPGGVRVTLSSEDPGRLLLSPAADRMGSQSLVLEIPEGSVNGRFYLQALGSSGSVSYSASARGYISRMARIELAPSGVVLAPKPYGPPDEAELFRKDPGEFPRGFVSRLSHSAGMPLAVWTAQLDPVTLRSADLTVQPLRAGMSLTVEVVNSNPTVGKVASPVKIAGGSEFGSTQFTPLAAGSTVISLITPEGFAKSSNSTAVTAIVKD